MISTQDKKVLGILDLVGEKQTDGLQRLFSSVYVVSEEQVICLGRKSSILEEAEKIVILAVNITANLHHARCEISIPTKSRRH